MHVPLIQAVQRQFDLQRKWSSDHAAAPFEPEALKEYLNTAKDRAPILPGTIVYIRPYTDGLWGDGLDPKFARSNGAINRNAGLDGLVAGAEGSPRLCSASRSTYRWGLVSEPPSPEQQLQLVREQARSRGSGRAIGGASTVGMTQRVAAGNSGVEMPMAPQPQWFAQQQQPLDVMQHHLEMPYHQLGMQHQQQQQHALYGNTNDSFQLLPANSLGRQDWGQQGASSGNLKKHCATPSFVPDLGNGAGLKVPVVWIANPSEGKPPLQVERSRVMGREFEEEAMNVLWGARGSYVLHYMPNWCLTKRADGNKDTFRPIPCTERNRN